MIARDENHGFRSGLRDELGGPGIDLTAKDGTDFHLRLIRPDDAPSLMRGYDAMSEQGKWFRMLHALPHLTPEMAAEFCAPDPDTEVCVVVEGRGALHGEILGGARAAGIAKGSEAEFSVSLRPEAQGLGLARLALETVIAITFEGGSKAIFGIIASANTAMLGLARRIGFEIHRDQDDPSLMIARLENPKAA